MIPAICHPERRHRAHGECDSCYQRRRRGAPVRRSRGLPPDCHPDRRHQALGLCAPCYNQVTIDRRRYRPACHPDRYTSQRDRSRCVDCYRREVTEPRKRLQHRQGLLRRLYGITPEDFEILWTDQAGRCALCLHALVRGRSTHIDHDHHTNRVRGLLCAGCNRALGLLGDDLGAADRLAAYLRVPTRPRSW